MTLKNSIDVHKLQFIMFLCGSIALGISYLLQYVMHFVPCELCLYARQVWKLVSVFSLLGALLPPVNSMPKLNSIFYYLTVFWLALSVGLAISHFGIEKHWWSDFVSSCSVNGNAFAVQETIVKSCSDPDYIHLGSYVINFSITFISLIYSLVALIICVLWRVFNNFNNKG